MRIRAAAAALVISTVLVACSNDPAPSPLPVLPTASPTPTALSVPPEALAETPHGAAAFTRYYFAQVVNEAYTALEPSMVRELSAAECGSCANIVSDIERLREAGLRVEGLRFKIAFAEAPPADPDGSIIVDFRFSSDPYVEQDENGATLRQEPAQTNQDAQVKLVPRPSGGWIVEAIRTVGS